MEQIILIRETVKSIRDYYIDSKAKIISRRHTSMVARSQSSVRDYYSKIIECKSEKHKVRIHETKLLKNRFRKEKRIDEIRQKHKNESES